jgi:hypothetical protein
MFPPVNARNTRKFSNITVAALVGKPQAQSDVPVS